MIKKRIELSVLLSIMSIALICAGCAAVVVGAASGAGVYTYITGSVKRTYFSSFNDCVDAGNATLNEMNVEITEEIYGDIKTTIKAKRRNASPVAITFSKLEPKVTEISVRSGLLGVWDKKLSELIHAEIIEKLRK